MPRHLISIGGGDVGPGETAAIDRELLRLTGKEKPQVLFVPTASRDDELYVDAVRLGYGRLGAEVEVLRLYGADADDPAGKIAWADAIYVGGGNTKAMLVLWRQLGVDHRLREHFEAGKPIGGLSAGAICWYRLANSDWPKHEGIPGINSAPLAGLGWIDLAICPHTQDQPFRLSEFCTMIEEDGGPGVGIDDGAAFQVRDDTYRVLSARPGAGVHWVTRVDGVAKSQFLAPHDDFRPLSDLRGGVI